MMGLINNGICLFNFILRECIKDRYERLYSINDSHLKLGSFGEECLLKGDIKLGENSKIGSRAIIKGNVNIGKNSFISPGAVIVGDLTIGDNCYIECGTVIFSDIKNNSYVFGNPSKIKNNNLIFIPKLFNSYTESHVLKSKKIAQFFPFLFNCGKNISFGDQIYIEGGSEISIGEKSVIKDRVMIATAHHIHDQEEDLIDSQQKWYNVKIGKNVYIGENSIIRGGISIGDGAKILPGSVVVRDIAANSLVFGTPAKPNLGGSSENFTLFPSITNKYAVYGHMFCAVEYFSKFPHIEIEYGALVNKELAVIGNKKIKINSGALIAPRVMLITQTPNGSGEISIASDSWIGAESIILPAVKISKGAVVGAGSVVHQSIPEGEIWAGNPAKKIGVRKKCFPS